MDPKCPKCNAEMTRGNIPNCVVNFQEGEDLKLAGTAPRLIKLKWQPKGTPAWICRECKLCLFEYNCDV